MMDIVRIAASTSAQVRAGAKVANDGLTLCMDLISPVSTLRAELLSGTCV